MNINKKILKLIFIAIVVILIALLSIYSYLNNDSKKVNNQINILRLDSNFIYEKVSSLWPIEAGDIETIKLELILDDNLNITIVDLEEKVLFSNSEAINEPQNRLLLDALYMDNSYVNSNNDRYKISQPIYYNDRVVGFVIFEKAYDLEVRENTLTNHLLVLIFTITILTLLLMSAILLFGKKKYELKKIDDGLKNISKGILRPIELKNNSDYFEIYNTYNMLVEELSYIMKQQQSYEGKRKTFLTMISHEMKTPIATINAYVEGLVSGVAKDDDAKEKYIKIISNKMKQLTIQVEDFFKYAQEDANRFKYNFEEYYADELLDTIFNGLVSIERPQTKIENILPKCIFKADKIRLEQVITNLYNNALKHTINKDKIVLKAYREDNDIVIEIEDFGEGISPKDLPYIFNYYYQGQTSKTSDYEGIGLGLAICKAIVDKHNGIIRVKSNQGQGTTIFIKIPLI